MTTTFVHPDRYWWHESVARELRRLRDAGYPAYNVKGIAGNIGQPVGDVDRYVQQMMAWGELEPAEPLWDYTEWPWVQLAS